MASSRALRITGRVIKYFVIISVFAVCIFMVWRAFFSDIMPDSMNNLVANDGVRAAYAQNGNDLRIVYQDQINISSAEHNKGYFGIMRVDILPEANQIQIVFRYNNSTLRYTKEDFSLETEPSKSDEVYDVTLVVKTESEVEGEFAETRIQPTYFERDMTSLYNYRLFVYDLGDMDLSSLLDEGALESIFLDVYYNGAIDYESAAYGTLCIYDYITETYDVRLSSADKRAIEGYCSK